MSQDQRPPPRSTFYNPKGHFTFLEGFLIFSRRVVLSVYRVSFSSYRMLSSSRRALSFSQRSWSFQKFLSWDFSKSFPTMIPGVAGLERGGAAFCTALLPPSQISRFPSEGQTPLPFSLWCSKYSCPSDPWQSPAPSQTPQNIYSFSNHMRLEQRKDHKNLIFCSLFYLIILQLGFKGLNYLSCFIRCIMTPCTVPPAPQRE